MTREEIRQNKMQMTEINTRLDYLYRKLNNTKDKNKIKQIYLCIAELERTYKELEDIVLNDYKKENIYERIHI